jgi:glycosyltransferase involved in cell wall biosynthesis
MRILFVTPYYKPAWTYGGPARSIPELCEGLARLGAQVTVLTTNANGARRLDVSLGRPVQVDGVEVHYYPLDGAGTYFYSRELARACSRYALKHDIAILECLWQYVGIAAAAACRRAGIPYIVPLRGQLLPLSLRHSYWKKYPFMLLFGRRYLDRAAGLYCSDYSEVQAVTGLRLKAPSFVVPNSVNTAHFGNLPARGALRRKLGIADDAVVMLFSGRLCRQKRPEIAVEALAAQSPSTQAHLIVAGPDQENLSAGLRARAAASGCEARLHIIGMLNGDEILQALADSDLLLMPSEVPENFGMAAAEAMAAGLPVLTSDAVPVGRWAVLAGGGRSLPCAPEAFSNATRELLANPTQLREMGERGKQLARERFDQAVVARQMLANFKSVISTGAPLREQLAFGESHV